MAEKTGIAWTDHTFNPVEGCTPVSPGCANCYAARMSRRFGRDVFGPGKPRRTFGAKYWAEPLRWDRAAEKAGVRRRVFCGSMCDVFEDHPDVAEARKKLWALIHRTPNLDWLLLTKRPERMWRCVPAAWDAYRNVWLGVSIENNDYAWRADELRSVWVAVRFVSYEPALGPLDVLDLTGIDWVIYGGESGPNFRPDKLEWAQAMYERCVAAGVPFFFKQRAARRPGAQTVEGQWWPFLDVREVPGRREAGIQDVR